MRAARPGGRRRRAAGPGDARGTCCRRPGRWDLAPELIACLSPAERSPPFSATGCSRSSPARRGAAPRGAGRSGSRLRVSPTAGSRSQGAAASFPWRERPLPPAALSVPRLRGDPAPRVPARRSGAQEGPSQRRGRGRAVVRSETPARGSPRRQTLTQFGLRLDWPAPPNYVLPRTLLLGMSSPSTHALPQNEQRLVTPSRPAFRVTCGPPVMGAGNKVGRGSPLWLRSPTASSAFPPAPAGARKLGPCPISSRPWGGNGRQPRPRLGAAGPSRAASPSDSTGPRPSVSLGHTRAHTHGPGACGSEPRSHPTQAPAETPRCRRPPGPVSPATSAGRHRRRARGSTRTHTPHPRSGSPHTAGQNPQVHAGPGVTSGTPGLPRDPWPPARRAVEPESPRCSPAPADRLGSPAQPRGRGRRGQR